MRVRDFQQVLGKFTKNEKGTIISDCPIYIETMDGRLEEIRKIELQESRLINSPEPCKSCTQSRVFRKIYVTYF
jgi:hypothetical protein